MTFVLLFVWFAWGPSTLDPIASDVVTTPVTSLEDAPPTKVKVRPKREAILSDPPVIKIAGFERTCQECHKLFESARETSRRLTQHQHIVLEHGLNDRCFNCHDREDRNRFVLHSGETVPYTEVHRLCAKCHGPTFRDWQMQIHGRTDGYWNPEMGWTNKLTCTECHDPHAPAFGYMAAWPAPDSLRVKEMPHEEEEAAEHMAHENPLRRWEYLERSADPHPPAEVPSPEQNGYGTGAAELSHDEDGSSNEEHGSDASEGDGTPHGSSSEESG